MKAYILTSRDDRKLWIDAKVRPNEREALRYWTLDLNKDTAARRSVLGVWNSVVLELRTHKGKPDPKRLKDIHGFSGYAGLSSVVSDRCRVVLQNEFPDSALYLPVEIEGLAQRYWALWITDVVDALDLDRSQLTTIAPTLTRVGIRCYREEAVESHPLFRLPMVYGEPDHVTDQFKAVIEKYKLTNFLFWDKTGEVGRP
jgi:hypothetical protein